MAAARRVENANMVMHRRRREVLRLRRKRMGRAKMLIPSLGGEGCDEEAVEWVSARRAESVRRNSETRMPGEMGLEVATVTARLES